MGVSASRAARSGPAIQGERRRSFYADDACCTSILDEWCPKVNLFEGPGGRRAVGQRTGIVGTVVGVGEAGAPPGSAPLWPRQPYQPEGRRL